MKKTILALTIPALFATSASAVTVYSDEGAKVDIYGRIQYEAGEMKYKSGSNEANNFGGEGEARLGVNVEYALNNDIDLIGKLEWQVVAEGDDATGSDSLDTRYAWAGYRFQDTTELTFGRSQDPIAQVLYLSDIFNIFGGRAGYGDTFELSDKVDDQVRVSYAANGLDLRGAYAFSDGYKLEKSSTPTKTELNNQWSLSAGYTFPVGVGVYAAYEQQDVRGNADSIDAWFAGASYTVDGFFFSGLYTQREQGDVDTKGFELTGTYNVDAWTLLAQYSYEETDNNVRDFDSIDAWTLGVQYDLTAKAKLYAEYEINDDDRNTDDRYGLGIQYNF